MCVFCCALQSFLSKLITEDLPNLMILPRKLTFEIPPSLAAVAGAAIGEDIVKRAILNAVVNSDQKKDISEEKLEETLTNLMDKSKTPQEIMEMAKMAPAPAPAPAAKESREGQSEKGGSAKEQEEERGRGESKAACEAENGENGAAPDLQGEREAGHTSASTSTSASPDAPAADADDADTVAAERLKELVKPWTQGGITLPQAFQGELLVKVNSARGLPGWTGVFGEPIPDLFESAAPYCMLRLGSQVDSSRKFQRKAQSKGGLLPTPPLKQVGKAITKFVRNDTRMEIEPVWNQEFQFLVQDVSKDELVIQVKDSEFLGRSEIGYATLRVADLQAGVQVRPATFACVHHSRHSVHISFDE